MRTVLLACLGLSLVSIAGCSGARPVDPPVAPAGSAYPAQGTATFLDACRKVADGDGEFCACLLQSVQTRYSYEQYLAIDKKLRSGGQDAEFEQHAALASEQCRLANHSYPMASHVAFLANCTLNGSAADICACTLIEVETAYDFAHFAAIDRTIAEQGKDESFSAFIPKAVQRCKQPDPVQSEAGRAMVLDPCSKSETAELCACVGKMLDTRYSAAELAALYRRGLTAWPDPEFGSFLATARASCREPDDLHTAPGKR